MNQDRPQPDRLLQLINGYWTTGVISAAAELSIFDHLEAGALNAADLASSAAISERGAQTLLDGLVSIGLVQVSGGTHRNTPEASVYLVTGTSHCLADFARLKSRHMAALTGLPEVVRAGGPLDDSVVEVADNPHWQSLVVALAAQSVPAAEIAATVLGIADMGVMSILDVGGGAGAYSLRFLRCNPLARATQVDWAPINAIARRQLDEAGLGDRFDTVDSDFHTVDLGRERFDVAVYSHIAHQEGPEANVRMLTRMRQALRPGGALVICDYVVNDDRAGPAFPLMFAAEMLLKSPHGSTWRQQDYCEWLARAGLVHVTFTPVPGATLVVARTRTPEHAQAQAPAGHVADRRQGTGR